jgi:hypothetical protein
LTRNRTSGRTGLPGSRNGGKARTVMREDGGKEARVEEASVEGLLDDLEERPGRQLGLPSRGGGVDLGEEEEEEEGRGARDRKKGEETERATVEEKQEKEECAAEEEEEWSKVSCLFRSKQKQISTQHSPPHSSPRPSC